MEIIILQTAAYFEGTNSLAQDFIAQDFIAQESNKYAFILNHFSANDSMYLKNWWSICLSLA